MTSTAHPDPGSGRWWPTQEKPFRQPRWRDIPDPPRPSATPPRAAERAANPRGAQPSSDEKVVAKGPFEGRLRIDVADSEGGPSAVLHSWHEDGMRVDEPRRISPDRVRWTPPTEDLVLVSAELPGEGSVRWYRWNGTALVPTTEDEAFAWTPGRPALPSLSGSAEQIAWATRLRDDYLRRFPAKSVPRNCSADWWIRNRRALGVP